MTLLASPEREVDLDPKRLLEQSLAEGWGDGLPIIPPTPDLVIEHVAASGLDPSLSLGDLPPLRLSCTVERVAVNAVMAGAPANAMPLICAAVTAMIDPAFDLAGANSTTASVVPAVIVNGPQRHTLEIPFGPSAFGGVAGPAPAIGRAIRLIMRNVGGQIAGRTSESVFGQPGRVVGIVVGEWEERSPWPPLAERRGIVGDAVTVYGTLGTGNILDTLAESGPELLEVIGRSLGYMGNNNFMPASRYADQMVAINPTWANEVIARDIRSFEDVREIIWRAASLPIDAFPAALRAGIEEAHRIEPGGRVMLMDSPDELHIFVCGGLGGLHATMLPGYSHSIAVTRAVTS